LLMNAHSSWIARNRIFDAGGELLRRLGAIAFVNPRLEQVQRGHLSRKRSKGNPAALAETIAGRLGERQLQRFVVCIRKLDRNAEWLAWVTQIGKCLVVDCEVVVAGPRALRMCAWIGEAEGPQLPKDGIVRVA